MITVESAVSLISKGKHEKGLRTLDALADRNECLSEVLAHRAFYHRAKGDYAAALEDYSRLMDICPNDVPVIAYKAELLARVGRHREAIQLALRALAIDPLCEPAVEVIAQSQQAIGLPCRAPSLDSPKGDTASRALNPVIQKMESNPDGFPFSVMPEVGRVLYTLVRMMQPMIVFETGSLYGYSGLCMAQALEDIGRGHLHCFDLFPENIEYRSPVVGHVPDNLELIGRHFQEAGLRHRATFHRGDSARTMQDVAKGLTAPVGMAFIDGDHRIRGCARDWVVLDEILEMGGVIVFHDTEPKYCGCLGPRYLIEALRVEAPEKYGILNLPTREGFGLGVIQKLTAEKTKLKQYPSSLALFKEALHLRLRGR